MDGDTKRRHSNQHGFTLIEVALAISILAVMVVLNYKILTSIIEAKQLLDDQRDGMFIANSLLTRLSRELQLASAGRPLLPSCDAAGSASNSGSGNQATSGPRYVLIGEEKSSSNVRGDTITFLARDAGQYIPDGGTHSGVVQITYRVEPDPDQKGVKDATQLLVRDEVPYRQPVARACQDALHFPITKNLVGLEFNYFDKKANQWSSSWNNEKAAKLPQIVQFKVTLRSPGGHEETYTSAVALKSPPQ